MYEGIDEDLAGSYDAKKFSENQRKPKFPDVAVSFEADLLRVVKDKSQRGFKFYGFTFRVTKSNNELVPEGATYTQKFYPGASDEDYAKFWRKVTPLLMAVFGETNMATFVAPEKLGELLSLCKAPDVELKLAFGCDKRLEEARPDRATGKYKPDQLEEDGVTPKKFPMHDYRIVSGAPAQQAA